MTSFELKEFVKKKMDDKEAPTEVDTKTAADLDKMSIKYITTLRKAGFADGAIARVLGKIRIDIDFGKLTIVPGKDFEDMICELIASHMGEVIANIHDEAEKADKPKKKKKE